MTTISYKANKSGIDRVLYSPGGPVGMHLTTVSQQALSAARTRVGVKSGKLRGTIALRQRRHGKDMMTEISASTPYAKFHHDGTAPHVIRPRRARVLVFQAGGATVFAQSVNHPGTRPNPFLREALRDVGLNPR